MKDKLFIVFGKLTFAMLCILVFLAVGKFVGHGIVTAWDRQAHGEQAYINSHKADIQAHWNKE
ncbi:hypothetical protein ENHY17A_50125 [Moraxellaceae bacterium 17A]|nr:hypothetical protein ENHY17A_50125 [Moraxellaceae bacterium 17A]